MGGTLLQGFERLDNFTERNRKMAKKIHTLFDELGYISDDVTSLSMGAPDFVSLKSSAQLTAKATSECMVS